MTRLGLQVHSELTFAMWGGTDASGSRPPLFSLGEHQ